MPMSPVFHHVLPYYQPILSVADGSIYGYEVLGRYTEPHKEKAASSLGPFFADQNNDIKEKKKIDRHIRYQALRHFRQSIVPGKLFINISPLWLKQRILDGKKLHTLEIIGKLRIDYRDIVIEIMEEQFNDEFALLNEFINIYRQKGCKIAVDDFYFHDFDRLIEIKPDFVKVDLRLVRKSSTNNDYKSALYHISRFCQELGISVLCEGVSNEIELISSIELGAAYIQGFYFSPAEKEFQTQWKYKESIKKALEAVGTILTNRERNILQIENELNSLLSKVVNCKPEADNHYQSWLYYICNHLPAIFFRAYICDKSGNQKSANLCLDKNGQFVLYYEYVNKNWSWRPYFYHNTIRMECFNRGVLSQQYIDIKSQIETVTFSYPLGDDLYIFLDLYKNNR